VNAGFSRVFQIGGKTPILNDKDDPQSPLAALHFSHFAFVIRRKLIAR